MVYGKIMDALLTKIYRDFTEGCQYKKNRWPRLINDLKGEIAEAIRYCGKI